MTIRANDNTTTGHKIMLDTIDCVKKFVVVKLSKKHYPDSILGPIDAYMDDERVVCDDLVAANKIYDSWLSQL